MITFKLSDNRQWKEPWLIHRSVYLINNEIRTDQLPAFSQIKRIVRPHCDLPAGESRKIGLSVAYSIHF